MNVFVLAAPIGDYLGDLSFSSVKILKTVKHVFIEQFDGFTSRLTENKIVGEDTELLIIDSNSVQKARKLIQEGEDFAILPGSGIPSFLDPGSDIVHMIHSDFKDKVRLLPIGMSSALDAAMSISGINFQSFYFAGHYPESLLYVFSIQRVRSYEPIVFFVKKGQINDFKEKIWKKSLHNRTLMIFKNMATKVNNEIIILHPLSDMDISDGGVIVSIIAPVGVSFK